MGRLVGIGGLETDKKKREKGHWEIADRENMACKIWSSLEFMILPEPSGLIFHSFITDKKSFTRERS